MDHAETVPRAVTAVATIVGVVIAAVIAVTVEIANLAVIARIVLRNRPRATRPSPLDQPNPDPHRTVPPKVWLRFSHAGTIANPASSGLPATTGNRAAMLPNRRLA